VRVLVTGGTGYIGGRLVPALTRSGHDVRCFARDAARLTDRFPGVEVAAGDVFDRDSVVAAMRGCNVAYYLIHSMTDARRDFTRRDREAATIFGEAARDAGVERIIYLGGLGADGPELSRHLRSRHEVGALLGAAGVPVTEFRAAVIVGAGSVSFEMVRYLTERLPVMVAPRWVKSRIQPIHVLDVIAYLVAALTNAESTGRIIEIGGADVLTYGDMMRRYARVRGLVRKLLIVPVLTPRLSSYWVHLVTPIPAAIARPLIDGLANEVIVHDDGARRIFPAIVPIGYDEAVTRALDRYDADGPETTWFDAFDVKTLPGQFSGATQGMLVDRRERVTRAEPAAVYRVFTSLGGKRGWLYADWLWELRGVLDRLVGGIGTRRGRRSATGLRVGDAVDFWRVEACEAGRLLRLRAEMKLPGAAWLEFETSLRDDGSTSLKQTAFFDPRGALGFLYWYAALPFHDFIFANMASRIVALAEAENRLQTAA
jgi:uncharacterized protein YbjT (DUF2867 family)